MSDESKKPLPDFQIDLDPDATAVVDARSVWAALERAERPLPQETKRDVPEESAKVPTPSVKLTRPKEEEDLDQAWEDSFDMSDLAETREAPAASEDLVPENKIPTAPPPPDHRIPTAPPPENKIPTAPPPPTRPRIEELDSDLLEDDDSVSVRPAPMQVPPALRDLPPEPRPASPSTIVTPAFGVAAVGSPSAPPPPPPPHSERVEPPSRRQRGPSAVEMEDRFSIGDFAGAMEIAEALLARDPEHEEANECLERSRLAIHSSFTSRLGPLDRVPLVAIPREQLRWLTIDHRAGFILSHVDGVSNLEEIIDISGMPELDALRILAELLQQRIISFR